MPRIWPRMGSSEHHLQLTTPHFEKIGTQLSQPLRQEDQAKLQKICNQYLLDFDLQTATPNYGDVKSLLERLEKATERLQKLLAEFYQDKPVSTSALWRLENQLSCIQDDDDSVYGIDRVILQLESLQLSNIRARAKLEERFGANRVQTPMKRSTSFY